ncbi:MAG TPA: serpin family protein [Bryobacteraceae bacterium]|nr:serpin family protein [Bryobacteraceae bacterium]
MKRLVLPIFLAAALPAADSRIMPAMNAFTTAAYKQLAQGDANLILSPFNIATALSMALAGARGQTSEEIQSVLHLKYDSTYDAGLGALLADVTKAGNTGGNELHIANGLWVQQGLDIQPAFENTLANNYHAPLTPLDFIANPEAARSEINRWTEVHTNDKIKNLLQAGSLDAQTRLVLTSAIYFYGKWQNPFVTSRTQPAPFTLPTGATTQANFMNQTSNFGYTETPSAQILEMRYAGTGIAFDVLLPKTLSGLTGLEKSLTLENLNGWLVSLTTRNVQVSLPKFRAESEFSLRKALSTMGMPTAFVDKADFSGIEPKRGVAISEVVHKAFVDVSEQGTEAAAATGITMRTLAMHMPEQAVVFRADHPFIFLIRDTRTEVVLFIGRLMMPR